MLDSATIDGLKALRLDAMAAALAEQREQASYTGLGFDERLGLLVDRELTARASRRMDRCLKAARLRRPAAVEDIDFRHPRGLDRAQILSLAQAHWASNRRAIVITGPTGSGKTYLACALAHAAIKNGHTALYQRAPRMLDELAIARGDGRLARLLATWARVSVLVIDDLLIRPLTPDQGADLLEVIEDRAGLRAPSSPASSRSRCGTRPSPTPPSPTPPSTGSWTTPSASNCPASPCAAPPPAPTADNRRTGHERPPRARHCAIPVARPSRLQHSRHVPLRGHARLQAAGA